MGNCWASLADDPSSNPLPIPTTINDLNPAGESSFIGDSTYQTEASTNITWASQASSSFGANQISQTIVYNASNNLRVFTYAQLKTATHNFRRDMVVGRGGFGKVYKGGLKEKLPSHGIKKLMPSPAPQKLIFAVKKLNPTSKQGFREWVAELNFLGSLSHPNLVKLLGYSTDNGIFLIYDFMPNGSLNYHLFGKGSVRPLPWDTRFQIALGIARGLAYLHTVDVPIIHKDVKSSNVLLDKFFNAKLSDFGLASRVDAISSERAVSGTLGYLDPEYIATGHYSVKSDVYSFGIVMVETLTGLRAIDNKRPIEQVVLTSWVKPYLSNKRKLKSIMDSRLEGKYPYREASQIAMLAIRCLNDQPRFRPSIQEIVDTLEQVEACHKTAREREID